VEDLHIDNIKRHNKEIKYEIVIRIHLVQDKDKWQAYECSSEPSGSMKQNETEQNRTFLDYLNDHTY
jgi:hypothetical protein